MECTIDCINVCVQARLHTEEHYLEVNLWLGHWEKKERGREKCEGKNKTVWRTVPSESDSVKAGLFFCWELYLILGKYQHDWVTCHAPTTPPIISSHRWGTDAWSAWHSPPAVPQAKRLSAKKEKMRHWNVYDRRNWKNTNTTTQCFLFKVNVTSCLTFNHWYMLKLYFSSQTRDPAKLYWWDLLSDCLNVPVCYLTTRISQWNKPPIHCSDMFVSINRTKVHVILQLQEECIHAETVLLWPPD